MNADVLQGEKSPPAKIDPKEFIKKSFEIYPNGILSLGWTTTNCPKTTYSWSNIYEAYSLLKTHNFSNIHVTLPVRALWSVKSINRLLWLHHFTKCSYTIWSHETDPLSSLESLLLFRKYLPKSVVFYDLPKEQDLFLKNYAYSQKDFEKILIESDDFHVKNHLEEKKFDTNFWKSLNENVLMFDYGCALLDNSAGLIGKIKDLNFKLKCKFEFFNLSDKEATKEIRLSISSTEKTLDIFINSEGSLKILFENKLEKEVLIPKSNKIEYIFNVTETNTDYIFSLDGNDLNLNFFQLSFKLIRYIFLKFKILLLVKLLPGLTAV